MTDAPKTKTAAAWKKAKNHTVVLPSGFEVTIRIPDLARMIETGSIPQTLLDVAIKVAKGAEEAQNTPEMAAKEREFKDLVVLASVVEPRLTEADLDAETGIPVEDKDMIVEFATRSREFDAEGNHIAGLHLSSKFRTFRGIAELYEDVEGLQGSGSSVA